MAPRFAATLAAALDFGLDAARLREIAQSHGPAAGEHNRLVDALAGALMEQGVVALPASP